MRRILLLLAGVAVLAAGCSSATTTPPASPSASPSAASPTASPQASPSPSATSQPATSPTPTPSYTWKAVSCTGRERWQVKTGTDKDVAQVNLGAAEETTIAHLTGLPAPKVLPPRSRIAPVEVTVYQVKATLTAFKLEPDQDYHLILEEAGTTMIAEIPNPACVGAHSRLLPGIERARAQFDARYHPSPDHYTDVSVPVTVTGVGFWDFPHGQRGVASNAIEIHPVLDIIFGR